MFVDAFEKARQFTHPAIIFFRRLDGVVRGGPAAFVVLNKDGWIVTARHLADPVREGQKHLADLKKYQAEVASIEKDKSLSEKQKQRKIRRVKENPEWITNVAFWWGHDGVAIKDAKELREADLVVGRLEPWDATWASEYATIKDPAKPMGIGRSLCRLGFPFHEMKASFDNKTGFTLESGALPVPFFPIEGIYTRRVLAGKSADGKYDVRFLETSSPGLRGQSGGPIFDTQGTVWAIQSHTKPYPLGFTAKVQRGGQTAEEHQVLNVGLGIHAEVVVPFLRDNNIDFQLSDY